MPMNYWEHSWRRSRRRAIQYVVEITAVYTAHIPGTAPDTDSNRQIILEEARRVTGSRSAGSAGRNERLR